ncbi:MAG: hypothetical protein ACHQRM_04930 [Bacteroidia bacterium]
MSKKGNAPVYIIIGCALVVLVLLFYWLNQNSYKHNWSETYKQSSKEPYGTSLVSALLKDRFGKDNFVVGRLSPRLGLARPDSSGIRNYIFIGSDLYLNPDDGDSLLSFIHQGGKGFIAAHSLPSCIEDSLHINSDYSTGHLHASTDSTVHLNFYHPSFSTEKGWDFHYELLGKTIPYDWEYFKFNELCDTNIVFQQLGYISPDKLNFARFPYGKGWFYIHVNPIIFTNLHMIRPEGLAYSEKAFSHLPSGKTWWDESSKLPSEYSHRHNAESAGPLNYILSQTSFRWAWYTMLLLILAYFLFRTVRRQRVIPLILPNENTSLEFIQTIGSLYYQQQDHPKLCAQKMKLFLLFIRDRYYLQTNIPEEKLIAKIAAKSKIPPADVALIFSMNHSLQNTVIKVDADDVIAFHKQLEHFYRHCT